MAIRQLRYDKDEILRKRSKEVEVIDNKIRELVLDMLDTMYKNDGVGLAAPQVGVLKRIVVYDVGDGPHALINPKIVKKSGKQVGEEGCLSYPNIFGMVERPQTVTVESTDIEGNIVKYKASDLEAVVICHEIDHLDGVVFLDTAYDVYEASDEEIKAAKKTEENKKHSNTKKSKKCKK